MYEHQVDRLTRVTPEQLAIAVTHGVTAVLAEAGVTVETMT